MDDKVRAVVVAVVNGKGGVAKTTTTLNVAAVAARGGASVLLVDLDPRYSLTRWIADPAEGRLVQLLQGELDVAGATIETRLEGVRLIGSPGDPLEEAEQQLASASYREEILDDALRDELDDYDLVLLDCPANLGLLAVNALHAADRVLIPVSMQDEGAFNGIDGVLSRVQEVAKRRSGRPEMLGVLRTRVVADSAAKRDIEAALASFDVPVLDVEIPESRWFQTAGTRRKVLAEWRPALPGAQAYEQLTAEVLAGNGKPKRKTTRKAKTVTS
jgi:chromosome partitioning protein